MDRSRNNARVTCCRLSSKQIHIPWSVSTRHIHWMYYIYVSAFWRSALLANTLWVTRARCLIPFTASELAYLDYQYIGKLPQDVDTLKKWRRCTGINEPPQLEDAPFLLLHSTNFSLLIVSSASSLNFCLLPLLSLSLSLAFSREAASIPPPSPRRGAPFWWSGFGAVWAPGRVLGRSSNHQIFSEHSSVSSEHTRYDFVYQPRRGWVTRSVPCMRYWRHALRRGQGDPVSADLKCGSIRLWKHFRSNIRYEFSRTLNVLSV